MPKKLSLLEHVDLKQAITEIITNPNENWKKSKEGEVHDREILLSKIITINLKQSGPTDYFVIPT
jgi:hypothetical protein